MPSRTGPLAALPDEMLRAIVEQASDGLFVTDAALRVEWVNDAACEMLALEPDALVGKLISELVEPEDLARAPLRSAELRAGIPTHTVRRFRTGSGGTRVLSVSAKTIGDGRMLGIARDETERLASERLAHSEASFRILIEASPDAVMVHRDWKIRYLNASAVRILGLGDASAGIGLHILDIVHPDDREWAARRISSLSEDAARTPFNDMRFVRGDGETIVLSVAGVRVAFEGEMSIVAVARDLSDQRRLQLQLAQSERMASLGTLAAGVGHEINNPLAYVLLNLQAIARHSAKADAPLSDLLAEHAASAIEGTRRAAKIVADLRAFSRFDEDARAIIDVRRALEVALATADHELKRRANVVTELDEPALVLGSEGKLAQIFLNLLMNAAQAIPDGHPSEHRIRVSARTQGSKVLVAITDTGVGISEAHRGRLFEPFFTTKPTGEGSGLGLAICHGLVTSLGGSIAIESVLGQGSTFTVTLPRAEAHSAPPSPPPGPTASPRRVRVLVVDDERSICRTIAQLIRHEVVIAHSAIEARALLERDRAFDVVLCDLEMPEMTGADLHRWALEHAPNLAERMLFMTGGRDGPAARALGGMPASRWLMKPFTVEALESSIEGMTRPSK